MRRPGYREAIEWLVCNDDCYWLGDYDGHGALLSVSASLVRDLFDVAEDRFLKDLRAKLKQVHPDHEVFKNG